MPDGEDRMRRAPGLFAALAAIAMVACGGRASETQQSVEVALDQANIPNVTVKVDGTAAVVHLRGTVGSVAERTRAQEVATAAVGTTGRVLNELMVDGLNTTTAGDFDGKIQDMLDKAVDNDPVLKERDITFEVLNGMVAVKGEVRSAAEKSKVSEIVQSAPGVKDMANALEIRVEP
jgi:osmotically-inducible protein OsmY